MIDLLLFLLSAILCVAAGLVLLGLIITLFYATMIFFALVMRDR